MRSRSLFLAFVPGSLLALGVVLALAPAARAEVRLHTLFSNHMVLQRDEAVPVWGWAEPGEEVTVEINGRTASGTADGDGKWQVELAAMEAGGPYTLTVTGTNTLTVEDVLVGEVWVCIGQSNMQWTFGNSHLYGQDHPAAEDNLLRLGRLGGGVYCEPQEDAGFNWSPSNPGNAGNYPAVAYYFGRELRDELGVPVGLIQQSMGATEMNAGRPPAGPRSSLRRRSSCGWWSRCSPIGKARDRKWSTRGWQRLKQPSPPSGRCRLRRPSRTT